MLGRTAANLYWLARYMERAENIARLLDVGYRVSLTPGLAEGHREQWDSTLRAAGVADAFYQRHETANLAAIRDFLLFDSQNPSSVYQCLATARNNARAVRAAITTEMWEALNATWLDYSQIKPGRIAANDLPALLDRIKRDTAQFRGAMLNTILRNDGYCFCQLGTFMERADDTARILDVKYYVLLPRADLVGSDIDLQQWGMILRAASAHRSYRHVYRDRYKAWNIAEFLILRREMPRSLAHSYGWIADTLAELERFYDARYECHDMADAIHAELRDSDMEAIFAQGLHEFLGEFIAKNNALSDTLARTYNFH